MFKAARRLGASSSGDFEWKSSIDGDLGTGDALQIPDSSTGRGPLSVGQHSITATHPGLFFWLPWRDSISLSVASVGCPTANSDVTTGTSGAPAAGQTFNETRAVDVTVLGGIDRIVEELTLKGLRISTMTASTL
ncbi:MAG: hypothetical protein OEU46_21890, partial [Alphaproteobacteria bacterium]|nr:hypothetical protein [Alphaproteobacteria bacterium]